MQVQLDNRIISSFLLYLDHEIQSKGRAFQNTVVRFYPITSNYAGTYAYAAPYKPLCNDISITGVNVLSGVYLNNSYIQVGQSGLHAINHYRGTLYFTGQNPSNFVISGAVAAKEVGIKITDKQDWKLLFETQYVANGTHPVQMTGLAEDVETTPIIFLRYKGQENKPFAFSRLDNQTIAMRAVVVANNEFQRVALASILKNLNYCSIPLVNSTPFDSVGNMTGVNYDYTQLSLDTSYTPMILSVKSIDLPQQGDYKNVGRNMAIVDFEISTIARPSS